MFTRVHLRVPDQHPRVYPYPYIAHPGGYGYQLESARTCGYDPGSDPGHPCQALTRPMVLIASPSHIFQAHTDIAVYVCWFSACSFRDHARSPSTASFDVLGRRSIRRLSEQMAGAIHDDGDWGSLRCLLRSPSPLPVCTNRLSHFIPLADRAYMNGQGEISDRDDGERRCRRGGGW
jgi:hypothetical protein